MSNLDNQNPHYHRGASGRTGAELTPLDSPGRADHHQDWDERLTEAVDEDEEE